MILPSSKSNSPSIVNGRLPIALTTLSTGGFSPYNDSVAHLSRPLQGVVLLFMLAAGANFALYYALARRRELAALRDVEFRVYLGIAAGATLLVSVDLFAAGVSSSPGGAMTSWLRCHTN